MKRVLVMHRARGILGPVVQKGKGKPATCVKRAGVKGVGNYISYKANNP